MEPNTETHVEDQVEVTNTPETETSAETNLTNTQLNLMKKLGHLNNTPSTFKELEQQTSLEMKLIRCIETQENSLVVTSNKLGITKVYDIRQIKNLIIDFIALGHHIDYYDADSMVQMVISNPSQYQEGFFHTQIGWMKYKNELIFRYLGVASKENHISSTYKGILDLNTSGNLETYIQGIRELVVPQKKLLTVFITGASGIINQALNLKDTNIMLSLCGESSSGKTTAEHVAMSFWGNMSTSAMNTINRTEQILTERQIIPVTVDDILSDNIFSSEQTKQKVISNQIFRYSTGEIKGRMYQKSERYYGAVLVSSEQSLFKKLIGSEADGQFYRMIEMDIIPGELTKDNSHARALNKLVRRNYGLGAEALGAYMVNHGYVGDMLMDLYDQQLDSLLEDDRISRYSRTANRLAVILVTALLMEKCFNLGINLEEIKEVLIGCIAEAFTIQDTKRKAYEDIHRLIKANPDKFASNQKEYNSSIHVGVYQQNLYGNHELLITTSRMGPLIHGIPLDQIISTETGDRIQVKQPPDQEMLNILKNWRERGWLNCCGSTQRLYRKVRLGSSKDQTCIYTIVFSS